MSDKTIDVTVVGSIFMDLICYTDRLPKPGETLEGTDFQTGFGGKGANQAVACARLGAKTAFVGKLGTDVYGKQYYDNFVSEGIRVDGIKCEENVPTGVASIIVGNDTGENLIVCVTGATGLVTPDYVSQNENLISQSKVVVCQLEISLESTLTALRIAKKHGITTIFNAAPAYTCIPKEIFSLADILCVNENEAELISGMSGITNLALAEKAIEKLRTDFDCKSVIITLGGEGALLWDAKVKMYHHYSAPKVKAVDTTGAGDAFVGTLAYCIASGHDLCSALRKSVLNASDSVLRKGTQSSYPHSIVEP